MASARLIELRRSRRNVRASGVSDEGRWSRRTYPLMIALHTVVIAGTLFCGQRQPSAWLFALLVAVQPVRLWVLWLLGNRWNTRGSVPRLVRIETRGPYAVIRHPNYLVVCVELFALPLAFGLSRLATVAGIVNGGLLILRIREEERLLMAQPDYRRHFSDNSRFIPGLF